MPPSRSWIERVAEARAAGRAPVEMRFDTRAKVEPPRRFACHRCGKAAPCARPARRKGDRAGRSPGLRVVTLAPPSQACAQWHLEEGSPPTVAGAAPDLAHCLCAAPNSLLAGRGRHTCTEAPEWGRSRVLSTHAQRVPGAAQHEMVRGRPGTQLDLLTRRMDPGSAAQRGGAAPCPGNVRRF